MKLKLEIELENQAFQMGYGKHEVSRILHTASYKIFEAEEYLKNLEPISLTDINGNTVGRVEIVNE